MSYKFIFFSVCVLKIITNSEVSSINLDGSRYTRYDPCGLGLIHFEKKHEDFWSGFVNLVKFRNLTEAVIDIKFKNPVDVLWTSQNSSVFQKNNSRHIIIEPVEVQIKELFSFDISLQDDGIPVIREFSLNNITYCNKETKSNTSFNSLEEPDFSSDHTMCGRRSIEHSEIVVTRTEAEPGDWPWHVALFIKDIQDPNKYLYQCGGSIISETAVLTAAHCVRSKDATTEANRIMILAGTTTLSNDTSPGIQKFIAKKVIIHPSYVHLVSTDDLAIIIVDKLKFTEYVQPICIWGPSFEKRNLYGLSALVLGFGRTENGTFATNLRSIDTIIQTDATCIAFDPILYSSLLNEFTICAGFGPRTALNPRNGDSGGGLSLGIIQEDQKVSWFLRGVLSKCCHPMIAKYCDPKYYVIYTDVAPHYTWLLYHAGLKYTNNIV